MAIKQMTSEDRFLVGVGEGQYVQSFDGVSVEVTSAPSAAAHFTYAEADGWARRLQKRGFPRSVVANLFGQPMTAGMVKAELQAMVTEAAGQSLPTTIEDLDAIPTSEQRHRYRTDPAFAQRFDELSAQPRQPRKARLTW